MNHTQNGPGAFLRRRPETWIALVYFAFYLLSFFALERITEPRFIIHSRIASSIYSGKRSVRRIHRMTD